MPTEVVATPLAITQAAALRGAARKAYDAFLDDVHASGCAALSYRLTGPTPLPRLCVKHLRGVDRVVVAFDADRVWVLLVGRHVPDPAQNIDDSLYRILGVTPGVGSGRSKPPCCDDAGRPPLDASRIDEIAHAVQTFARAGRRRG